MSVVGGSVVGAVGTVGAARPAYGAAYGAYAAPATYGAYAAPAMSYPASFGGFGYGAPAVDPARVEELKATQITQLGSQAESLKTRIGQQAEHQLAMIDRQADQEIAMLTA